MRCLILAPSLPWPLHGGRQLNTHHLARTLLARGHQVMLALPQRPTRAELAAWPLTPRLTIQALDDVTRDRAAGGDGNPRGEGWLAQRWRRYLGVDDVLPAAVARLARRWQPDYVEACGLQVPLWMTALPADLPRFWLAADEKLWFHLTMLRSGAGARQACATLGRAAVMAAYERCAARWVDAIVTVAPSDALAMRWVSGCPRVLMCPNGVDADHFRPGLEAPQPHTAIFWGRLDFEPNIAAVRFFVRNVWPRLRRRHADARLLIAGRQPTDEVQAIVRAARGVELRANPIDIRPLAQRSAVAVLPLFSGSGIKNKMLEAAAMGKAIVAAPAAVTGLRHDGPAPWIAAARTSTWIDAIESLWASPWQTARLGAAARQWVSSRHNWLTHALDREQELMRMGRMPAGRLRPMPAMPEGVAA